MKQQNEQTQVCLIKTPQFICVAACRPEAAQIFYWLSGSTVTNFSENSPFLVE